METALYITAGGLGLIVGLCTCPLVRRIRRSIQNRRRRATGIDSKLFQSPELMTELVENSPSAIFVKDREGRYLLMNRHYERMFRVRREEMLGLTDYEVFPAAPHLVAVYQANDRRVIESGEYSVFEEMVEVEGEDRPYISVKFPLRNQDGDIEGVCGISTDISEQKAVEEALRKSEERFGAFFDLTFQLMGVLNPEGTLIKTNKASRSYLAGDQDVIGKPFWETAWWTHDPEQQEKLKDAIVRCRQGDFVRFETTHPNPKGGLLYIDFSLKPIKNKDGEVELLIAEGRDITARILAERERLELESVVQHSRRMDSIGQLAGGVAHDFNNLLTAIQGNAELLKMEAVCGDEQQRGFLDQILHACGRARDLTQQLLTFARKGQLKEEPVEVGELVTEVVKLLSAGIDKRIEIKTELPVAPLIVMGDSTQLQNALLNLGFNARDAMPDGGTMTFKVNRVEMPEIPCACCGESIASGKYVEISVRDTGVGIALEHQARVFEPFFTTKTKGRGTGLGLAGVYGSVKSHGGHIMLESEPGSGTTFRVLLPESQASLEHDTSAGKESGLVRGAGDILLVDDEEVVRNFAAAALRSLGYQVHLCSDGLQAVEYYRKCNLKIDLVILDLTMPKLGGADAFRQIREFNPNARVVIASGYTSSRITEDLISQGALAMIQKPFRLEELSRIVADCVKQGKT